MRSSNRKWSLGQGPKPWLRSSGLEPWLTVSFLAIAACCGAGTEARAQAKYTASRAGDLQVGVGFTFGRSPYGQPDPPPFVLSNLTLRGGAFYTTFDFKEHYGIEGEFHQVSASQDSTIYERTYEIGPRYKRTYGRFVPYAKLLYGRGVFNFQQSEANLAYNLLAPGIGTDFRLRRHINLRADYEYQFWKGFPLVSQRPQLFTLGVAYHFGD